MRLRTSKRGVCVCACVCYNRRRCFVQGAWGGSAIVSKKHRHLLDGVNRSVSTGAAFDSSHQHVRATRSTVDRLDSQPISLCPCRADSMTWNPHKLMGVLLQCSAILLKQKVRAVPLFRFILPPIFPLEVQDYVCGSFHTNRMQLHDTKKAITELTEMFFRRESEKTKNKANCLPAVLVSNPA